MQQYKIIAGITETLGGLLKSACADAGFRGVEIMHEVPKSEKIKAKPAIACYMYHIGYAPYYKERTQNLVSTQDDTGNVVTFYRDAPLYLFANYLLCVFGNKTREESMLMGLCMKTFLEHPIITGDLLKGGCFYPDDRLNVYPKHEVEYEEVLSFWRSLNEEVRPTVFYHVKFRIESDRTSDNQDPVGGSNFRVGELPRKR